MYLKNSAVKKREGDVMNLFFKDERPLEQLLEGTTSSEFKFWAKTVLKTGWLEELVKILIRTGRAENKKEAIQYLEKLGLPAKSSLLKIAKGDFTGEISREPFRLLEQRLGFGKKEILNIKYAHYGIVGHQAIGDLVSGKIPDYQKAVLAYQLDQRNNQASSQGSIFKNKTIGPNQLKLFNQSELQNNLDFLQEIQPDNQISPRLEKEVTGLWSFLAGLIISHSSPKTNWWDYYRLLQPFTTELETMLFSVFPKHLPTLKSEDAFGRFLKTLTLMSLASLVPWFKNHLATLFREVPVLTSQAGVNGGRIDAIEILSINGHRPDKTEEELLRKMSENSYSSVGHLVGALHRTFGHVLEFRITDWKFMVGEGVEQGRMIGPSELEKPLEQHVLQVQNYATLANLDCYLQNEDGKRPWQDHPYFTRVRLVYILPVSRPVIHEFEVSPKQQKKIFQEEFVANLHFAKKQAVLRSFNNLMVGHVTNLLDRKEKQSKSTTPGQNSLFPEVEAKNRLKRVIDKYRRFADKTKIIEVAKRNKEGDDLLLMHQDKLAKVLSLPDQGGIKVGNNFDLETGGFLSCLIHAEKTPSMRLNIQEGFFKCFGCGIFGLIVSSEETPLIRKLHHNGRNEISFAPEIKKISQIVIPDKHHQIIQTAQQILNGQFKTSFGQTYVISRGVDPDLAHQYGAGYGRENFIQLLLESYSLDELIYYGLVAVSDKVTPNRGLCPLLAERGLSLAQMKRKMETKEYKMGLPYSVLEGRLTFPLVFENRYTSFYGRATWENCSSHTKHRKLSNSRTKVPHGVFNFQSFYSDASEVVIAEGVFDALSLMQMGWLCTIAIIGVNNRLNVEAMARSQKNLAIAFDHDQNKTGQTNTTKIIQYLNKINYPGTVRNFTEDFIARHPDFLKQGYKDFNEYLMKKSPTA